MISQTLFDDGSHRWLVLARDPERNDSVLDTNEYLIVSNDEAILLDPGGTEIFPAVLRSVARLIDITQLKAFFASHQDPDIMSSLPLWMGLCPDAVTYMPWLWHGFISHFGVEYVERFKSLPDEGGPIAIGHRGRALQAVPAHYCHSSGNFSVYDPHARILFSGDIGAALLPEKECSLFVEDFDRHIPFMRGFHQRWMPSNRAKNRWIERVRKLDVDMLCPQHGSILRGEQVGQFLDWFEALEVGLDRASDGMATSF